MNLNYEKIIGWGTSKYYLDNKEHYEGIIDYFVDSNSEKWGKELDGKLICNPTNINCEDNDGTLVIIFSSYYKEIEMELLNLGIKYYISAYELTQLLTKDICLNTDIINTNSFHKIIGTISRNNFTLYLGGTSKLIREQMEVFKNENYLHIHFYWKYINLKEISGYVYFIVLNGGNLLLMHEDTFEEFLKDFDVLIIHNLIDLDKRKIKDIINKKLRNNTKVFHYLHDFSLVCSNIKMTYNDQYFCESYKDNYNICGSCKYNSGRIENYDFYREFLMQNSNIELISPSENTKSIYKYIFPEIKNQIIVMPHQIYSVSRKAININSKIKFAYVGNKDKLKGWETFKEIVSKFKYDFEFYCFGYSDEILDSVNYVDVSFIKDGHLAMTLALKKYNIDIVLLWSVWPETYSYTYFESSAAGCFIITNNRSGNIAEKVLCYNNGIVFESREELEYFLANQNGVRKTLSKHNIYFDNPEINSTGLLNLINELNVVRY